jgi:hypothetical protein
MTIKKSIFLLATFFVFNLSSSAAVLISSSPLSDNITSTNRINLSKNGGKSSKILKIERFIQKMSVNFSSSSDKWLWYGLGFLALSVVMSVLPVVRMFAGLIGLVGVILIIYWLIKKLGI